MIALLRWLNYCLPLLYALTVAAYAVDFVRGDPRAARIARRLMEIVLVSHAVYLAFRTFAFGHVPLARAMEVLTSVAFAVAVVYVIVERRTRERRTGVFLVSVSFLTQAVSSVFIRSSGEFPAVLNSPLFAAHTASAVIGYAAFAVSAVYGALFLLLYHELKLRRFGLFFDRLPPLATLSRMCLRAIIVGLSALAVTIICGSAWAWNKFPGFSHDPKFLLTVVVWIVYMIAAWLHYDRHIGDRRVISLSLVGFFLLVFSAILSRLAFPTFHIFT
ncbi:MAG: cytochrome c biogenesis protein CcsA [Vicinamibacteria bacterium]|nr:cytochrome c biogenesis protein CcsA [Vicinamibacteria bacterium]